MVKKISSTLIVLFLFQIHTFFGQSPQNNNLIENFTADMNNAGLTKAQTEQITALLNERERLFNEDKKKQNELNAKYPYVFHNQQNTDEYINQKFVRSLTDIITIGQFRALFLPQFDFTISSLAEDKLIVLKKRFKFTADQETKLKKLLYETTTNEIVIKEYYSYDKNLSWNNYTEEKIKSSDKERELLKGFGLFYSKNTKTDSLIQKLKDAHVDSERINQILAALQILQERNDKRLKTWRENDAANAFNFHDPGDDEYAIYLDFREQLSKILKIEEFKSVFASQMQNRIIRSTQKEFEVIKAAYKLNEFQYREIEKMVLEKNTEKIVTEEYFKYSYELYQQKLRAVEFRHEKSIRETIQKMMELNDEAKNKN